MLRWHKFTATVGSAILALTVGIGLTGNNASAQDYKHYSDESRDYWKGYWGWYDGYYTPYYQRQFAGRPNYYGDQYPGSQVYRGRIYDETRWYRPTAPGVGVTVGPFSFQYWR